MVSNKTLNLLEFNKVRERVANYASSSIARERVLSSVPSFERTEVLIQLNQTAEAERMLNKYLLNPIIGFDSISEYLEKARVDATLNMAELLKVGKLLKSARIAKNTIQSAPEDITLLRDLVNSIVIDHSLEKDIEHSIVSEYEMSDKASEKLYSLRRKIGNLNIKLREKLLSYTRNNSSSKYLQDNLVTIREGRYVLPVKAECRSFIPGLVHDRSATGSTVFVEPFAIVELNNELRFLQSEEQSEIERILAEFTKRVKMGYNHLILCQNICILLDVVFCKAKYSTKIKGVFPQITREKQVKLQGARHPLIDENKVVAINVEVGLDCNILLITGPNTGGKTVSLKTTGLFCLMAYFGLFLPCDNASLYLFDNIYCDMGDEQSIENELSTFSSHVVNLKTITENATANSLVLLDELGGGTDPDEGAALAIGVLKFLELVNSVAIITTHYGELKEYALTSNNIKNASMQFDEEKLSPTYKLILGMPGTSNALKIAKKLGLCDYIVNNAYSALSEDKVKFEKILQNAEQLKRKSIAELEEMARIKNEIQLERALIETKKTQLDAQLERIHSNAQAETRRLIANATEKANEILDKMKEEKRRVDEASLLSVARLKNQLEDINYSINSETISIDCQPLPANEIKVGARAVVKSVGGEGTIKSINIKKKEVEITVGSIKLNAKFSDLGKPISTTKQKTTHQKKSKPVLLGEKASSGFSEREIMVLGKTVSEAIEIIEPLIISMNNEDDAKILRIVHGKGTGALGKGIQGYLKTCPLVAEYRYGRYGEGDSGATIVTIK